MYIPIKSFKKTKAVLFYIYVNVISTFVRGIVCKNI